MARALVVIALVAWLGMPAAAKVLCPPGQFLRPVSLRARFDTSGSYCVQFTGTLRLGGRSFAVVGERVPACGNDLREAGEQCDGNDSIDPVCCADDCTLKPGCAQACDLQRFPCAASEICVHSCGGRAVCAPREQIPCGSGPICACDLATTYPDRCAAFEAGTAGAHLGACQPASPPPPRGRALSAG